MCEIMDEYSREEAIDTAIDIAIRFQATTEQIVEALKEKFGLDRETALSRIENFKRIA